MNINITEIILQERKIAYAITDTDLKVVEFNGDTEMSGDAWSSAIGRGLLDVVPELVGCEEILAEILAGKLPRFHLSCVHREQADDDGRYLSMVNLPYRNAAGDIIGIVHLIEDITEKGSIEQRLTQKHNELRLTQEQLASRNQELALANAQLAYIARAKDDFLASMSHELRTPLTSILGLSEALKSEDYGPLNAKQHQSAYRIQESGQHLLSLINDILDVAKIEAGKLDLDLDTISVNDICQASFQMVKQTAYKKQITLVTNLDSNVDAIRADMRRLKQILVNLLSNAIKFTPDGGRVGLDLQGDPVNRMIHFAVWDTGIGIAPEHQQHLFQPFMQIDNALSRQHNGTGLGLALTQRLVELHNGKITVESTLGHGSCFTVSIPWIVDQIEPLYAAPPQEHYASPQEPAIPATECTLLLVDDHIDNALLVADFLRIRGYRVILAHDGAEALEQAHRHHPDLILMDIQMPDIDGIEAIQQLRVDPTLGCIPIIVLTALAMPKDRERCLMAGADDYVSKPIYFPTLLQAITAQLGQYRAVGDNM